MAKGMVINAIRTCAYAGYLNDIEAKNPPRIPAADYEKFPIDILRPSYFRN